MMSLHTSIVTHNDMSSIHISQVPNKHKTVIASSTETGSPYQNRGPMELPTIV